MSGQSIAQNPPVLGSHYTSTLGITNDKQELSVLSEHMKA